MNIPFINPDDRDSVRRAFQMLNFELGPDSEPEFKNLTLNGLTATRLLQTDGSKKLTSVSDLTSWIAGTENQIVVEDDVDGSLTLSLPQDYDTGATPTLGGLTIVNAITEFSTDGTLGGNSNSALPTEAAVKTYVDTLGGGYQPLDADLTSIAALGTAADKMLYTTDTDVWAEASITAFARSILDDANEATFKATVNLEIGTDVLAQQAIGIANDNLVEIDDADAADDDYAKFTANGLEGRSYAEVKTDLSLNLVENTALSTWAGTTNITTLGTIATGTWNATTIGLAKGGTGQVTAQAAINALSAVSGATNEHVLTKDTATGNAVFKAAAGGYTSRVSVVASAVQDTANNTWAVIQYDTESFDGLNEFNTGTYRFYPSVTGYYLICAQVDCIALGAGKYVLVAIRKNGTTDLGVQNKFAVLAGSDPRALITRVIYLTDSDYIEIRGLHNHGANRNLWGEFLDIHRLS